MESALAIGLRLLVATVPMLVGASSANAWTPYGHMVIAASAYDQLDPAVRETRLADLINADLR